MENFHSYLCFKEKADALKGIYFSDVRVYSSAIFNIIVFNKIKQNLLAERNPICDAEKRNTKYLN